MSLSSRRVVTDVYHGVLKPFAAGQRFKSTTSSIKAGLRAEGGRRRNGQPRLSQSGLVRSRSPAASTGRPAASRPRGFRLGRPSARGNETASDEPSIRYSSGRKAALEIDEDTSESVEVIPRRRGASDDQQPARSRSVQSIRERPPLPARSPRSALRSVRPSQTTYAASKQPHERYGQNERRSEHRLSAEHTDRRSPIERERAMRAGTIGGRTRPSTFRQREIEEDDEDEDYPRERQRRGPKVPTDEEVFEDGDVIPGPPRSRRERRAQYWDENKPEEDEDEDAHNFRNLRRKPVDSDETDIPPAIPYTTASSQFIYGANAVLASMRAQTRKFYKLWIHRKSSAEGVADIRRTAQEMNIKLVRTTDIALLDALSGGRPHNGVVIETSPLPQRPVLSLEAYDAKAGVFNIDLASQNKEEKHINGIEDRIPTRSGQKPLVVLLDGITDEGNMGNIIRTAHFYGADAVAIASNTCAPVSSAVVAKASAGAVEAIPIFNIKYPGGFVNNSRKYGWRVYATVAPHDIENDDARLRRQHMSVFEMANNLNVTEHPVLLMFGSEGEGLRDGLKSKADALVTIPGAPARRSADGLDPGIDSLNVASAAAVFINAIKSASHKRASIRAARPTERAFKLSRDTVDKPKIPERTIPGISGMITPMDIPEVPTRDSVAR